MCTWAIKEIMVSVSKIKISGGEVVSLHEVVRSWRQETVPLHHSIEHKLKIILGLKQLKVFVE